jgi:hypothetical protein
MMHQFATFSQSIQALWATSRQKNIFFLFLKSTKLNNVYRKIEIERVQIAEINASTPFNLSTNQLTLPSLLL